MPPQPKLKQHIHKRIMFSLFDNSIISWHMTVIFSYAD